MGTIRLILTIIFIIVCVAITVLVLMQEGKSAGLGALNGTSDSYWSKNKSRTMEGNLIKFTTILAVVFLLLAVVLNINKF